MIAASIIELTAPPVVVTPRGTAPAASLFGDLLRQALKASADDPPAAGSKAARRPQPDSESETTRGASANFLAAAQLQATVILPTPILQQQTIPLSAIQTARPATASLPVPPLQVPSLLPSVAVPIQTRIFSAPQPVSESAFPAQQNLTPNDLTGPPPPTIVTKPDLIANTVSAATAPDAPVHASVASKVEHWIENNVLSAVPGSIQALNPLPTLHAVVKALTGAAADPTQNSLPKTDASVPAPPVPGNLNAAPQQQAAVVTPPSVSDQSTGPVATGVATATAAQLAAILQANQTLPLTSPIAKSSVTAKASPIAGVGAQSSKDSTNTLNAVKQQLLSYTQKPGPQNSLKEQNQTGHAASDAVATAVPANQASSPTMTADHTSNLGVAALAPPAPLPSPAAEHAVNKPELPAAVFAPPTQPLPDINTAKIIQSVGQSEMRVGLRSPEFGNISISTSASRDVISAQISLDHSELARTLAVHLPEMQARLGGGQPMEVRIDMQGQATSQTHGSSTGMANHSADTSREEHSQRGQGSHARSGETLTERPLFATAAALAAGDLRLNERLDITA